MQKLIPNSVYVPVGSSDTAVCDIGDGSFSILKYVEETSLYTFTKLELEKLLGDAFDAGDNYGHTEAFIEDEKDRLSNPSPNKEQYISSILK